MSNKIKIDLFCWGYAGQPYKSIPATSLDIDVYVTYPSGRERSYSFDNYPKACAFVGRTLAKHPAVRCSVHVPCQTVMFNFGLYGNSKPQPAVKSVTLNMLNETI